MAYTLTIFPLGGGGGITFELAAADDQSAIAEAIKIVENRLGSRPPFVIREDNKVFYKLGEMPAGIELQWRDPPKPRQAAG